MVTESLAGALRWRWVDVPEPDLGSEEVLIGVEAAGLNHADLLMRTGAYEPSDASWNVPRDRVGFELAGTVVATGSAVRSPRVGARVMAQAGGSCAERVAVDAGLILPLRDVAIRDAAALPSGLLTAHDALTQAGFTRGDAVLVTGATSSVGRIAVQMARTLGAGSIIATARGRHAAAELSDLGAGLVIDTETDTIPAALTRAGHPGFSVALDHLGGRLLSEIVQAAPPRARIIQIGRLAGSTAELDLEQIAARRLIITGTTFRDRGLDELRQVTRRLADEPRLQKRWGDIAATIDSTFSLAAPEAAARRLSATERKGKLIMLRPAP